MRSGKVNGHSAIFRGAKFLDRRDAGRKLVAEVTRKLKRRERDRVAVLAIARGGAVVGYELARALGAPLDVVVVRKLGHPSNPELGLGAVTDSGVSYLDSARIEGLGVSRDEIESLKLARQQEARKLARALRGGRPELPVHDRAVVLVDDGLATGGTAIAAARALRKRGAAKIVLATPVASPAGLGALRGEVDDVACLWVPQRLESVSLWYEKFEPVDETEVVSVLEAATHAPVPLVRAPAGAISVSAVEIPLDEGGKLAGELSLPAGGAQGLVVFAHGTGSGMSSPRNRHVAATLQGVGLGTLLFDMLKPDERDDPKRLTDIDLLRDRVLAATGLLGRLERTKNLPLGLFGASTGAGAAFCAAAQLQDSVVSLVSRGGRPDFAAHCLERVRAPTLLVVGGEDVETLELNRKAMSLLPGEVDLEVIPGATHLFAEAGALEAVSHLAADWFLSCFRHSSSIVLHAL